jgi:hypothetical protein
MNSLVKTLKSHWLVWLVLALLIALAGGYIAGYRLDQAGFTRVGTLIVTGLPEKSTVYVDAARRISPVGGKAEIALTPGTHSVIVDSANNQPWNEIVTITQATNTTLAPIFVPTKIERKVIVGADRDNGLALARSTFMPTYTAPLMLENGCVRVYVEGAHIVAEAATTTPSCASSPYLCTPGTNQCAPTIVFSPRGAIHAVLPFPGRQDALVVAAGSLVYAIETDPREPQYFAPLFKGAVTGAALWSPTSVIITNGTLVIELPLSH